MTNGFIKDNRNGYKKLNSAWRTALEKYNNTANTYAKESYEKHGSAAMKAWAEAEGINYENVRGKDKDLLAYMIKQQTEERYKRAK